MQAITMIIPGLFYDSYIYSGILYLWNQDNSVTTIEWDKFVDFLSEKQASHLQFATHCAYRKGSYLYSHEWKLFRRDSVMGNLLHQRFSELSQNDFYLSTRELQDFLKLRGDNKFKFPHSDILFFHDYAFVGSSIGLESLRRTSLISRGVVIDDVKINDTPVLSMSGSNYTVAIASGSEGLHEYKIQDNTKREIVSISNQSCHFVRWMYSNIFISSYGDGYIADFDKIDKPKILSPIEYRDNFNYIYKNEDYDKQKSIRKLKQIVNSNTLFEVLDSKSRYVWGSHDKICLVNENEIYILKYNPRGKDNEKYVKIGSIRIENIQGIQNILDMGDIVSCDSSNFGYIIEFDNGLLVFDSQEDSLFIKGEPINWRVFAESKDYINQLHIIYDDHMKIISFYGDYFVNQDTKIVGISASRP